MSMIAIKSTPVPNRRQTAAQPRHGRLSGRARRLLEWILNNPRHPNSVPFFPRQSFITPGGRLGAGVDGEGVVGPLTDAGLIEMVSHESYRYLGDPDVAGYVRVTEAGRRALDSGRYRPGDPGSLGS